MRPRTSLQILDACERNGIRVEQIALRRITVRIGGLRWTYHLKTDGLWHASRR